ncbi:Uma2 family endonuclease [Desulfofundulus salinus]|uniref:Uma2 family endonuclease n=1 Tax=Desulfofundulus salinus TaxID=2419843 RepID=UPI001FA9C091|nr:Uma2 family endonuclease [Desulfofundulus salinum]
MTGTAPRESSLRGTLTYGDYLQIDDGRQYELIEGELILTPSPGFLHQHIAAGVGGLLRAYVDKHNMGLVLFAPFDVVLADNLVLQPDVLYLSRERFDLLTENCLKGAPDLVVEGFCRPRGRNCRRPPTPGRPFFTTQAPARRSSLSPECPPGPPWRKCRFW